jgi:phospholipid transport system substrate-binding protein
MSIHSEALSVVMRIVALLALLCASVVRADSAEDVRLVVEKNVSEIVSTFEANKPLFESEPEAFFENMEAVLSKIVDFRRIAGRVMGKYARGASKEQRDQFVAVFKASLFDSYAKALVESGSFEIRIVKAEINPRSDERATVDMDVTSQSGSVYPVSYSMYRNNEGEWLMENVIVFGVNIGLAFRDKFETDMRARKGSIDEVIAGWSVDIELNQEEG